jgi:hypothetical protein
MLSPSSVLTLDVPTCSVKRVIYRNMLSTFIKRVLESYAYATDSVTKIQLDPPAIECYFKRTANPDFACLNQLILNPHLELATRIQMSGIKLVLEGCFHLDIVRNHIRKDWQAIILQPVVHKPTDVVVCHEDNSL